jgi:putative transcriptional regulator
MSGSIPTDSSGTPVPASLDGYFLISETELMDPNFHRTVVLIISHNEEGAFGLVLNRPADATLGDLIEELDGTPAGEAPLFVGGPVEQHYLFTLHTGLPEEATSEYASHPAEGVVFEPVFQTLEEFLLTEWETPTAESSPEMNFYLGYAGWSAGQLEREIEEDAWLVIPADSGIVFHHDPSAGWNAALEKKGGIYQIISKTGFKPSLN